MASYKADIVICGAGIAGLWLFHSLRREGYDALLLEKNAIGCGQTIASQGIIHSGLKYALAGQFNAVAKSISTMPQRWREALKGHGPADLSSARVNSQTQYLLIPPGFMGTLIAMATKKALGGDVHTLERAQWPESIVQSGFNGTVIYMDELVLDAESVVHALAAPYVAGIRKADILKDVRFARDDAGAIASMDIGGHTVSARRYVFTAAAANEILAKSLGHDAGLETQHRPLMMGMMLGAPYELYAHCVGASEKPVMTVTTHRAQDGQLVWYLGGNVSERPMESNPQDVYKMAKDCLRTYMPSVDLARASWATLPMERIEGKTKTGFHLPDTPTLHSVANAIYGWPTKLTFAPMLTEKVREQLRSENITPSGRRTDWSFLPECPFTQTPWNLATWTGAPLAKRA